jgi:hypothetical protein
MTKLDALRAAVMAKLAYWDAMSHLEKAFDIEDPMDDVNDAVVDNIDWLASAMPGDPSPEHIVEEHVTQLIADIKKASYE